MQAITIQALTAAAGVIITVATGGAGAVAAAELVSWQVARMAMAQGMANLVITASQFETVGMGAVKSMTEGAAGGAATAAFEAAAKSETWRNGIIRGFGDTAKCALIGGAAGAATAGLMHAGIATLKGQLFGGTPGAVAPLREPRRPEDGGPATLKDEGPPTVRDDHPPVEDPDGPKTDRKPPNVGPPGATPGATNRARSRLSFANQREAGKAFAAEIKANPQYEAAVVVDRRDGSARLCFGDESTTDVPFGEHLEQVKHYHPGSGVTTDIGHRTPSFDDLKILKDTIGKERPDARSMIRWTDAGGVPHWTPHGVDGEKVWVRLPGADRKEFPVSIFDVPGRGRIEYNLWVEQAMAGLKE